MGESKDERSLCSKSFDFAKDFFANITVEPAVFLLCMGYGLYTLIASELYIDKVCRVNFGLGDEICSDLQAHEEEQVKVQKYVSAIKIYNRILQAVPGVAFTLFAGPWSDHYGRKLIMSLSLGGYLFSNLVFMANTYWFYELKAEYLLIECLQDLTGGYICFYMAAYAYLADVTPEDKRTKRMAFVSGLWAIGSNIGKALSGVIKTNLGFMYNFGFGMLANVLAILYVTFYLPDSIKIRNDRVKREHKERGEDVEDHRYKDIDEDASFGKKLGKFFDVSNLKAGFVNLFKRRPDNMRVYLLLMLACFEMEMFINIGDWDYQYLYLRRVLKWDLSDFTLYTTLYGVVGICCQYVFIPVMSVRLGFRDSLITLVDISGCFVQTLIIAFVSSSWMMYLAMCVAFLDSSSYSMIRSMVSKTVPPDEVGSVFSVMSSIQSFIPLVSSPFYGIIYRSTVEFMPNTHYFVIAGFFFVDWVFLMIIDRGFRKSKRRKDMMEKENPEEKEGLNAEGKVEQKELIETPT